MKRRDFLKGLLALSVAEPVLKSVDIGNDNLNEFLNNFSSEQIKAISNVEDVFLEEYSPYFCTTLPMCYKIKLRNGRIETYDDIRELREKYGDIFEYVKKTFNAELPKIYSGRYGPTDYTRWS